MNGESVLRSDGYTFIAQVPVQPEHFDRQGHLNNAAIGVLFNDLRIAYINTIVGQWWRELLHRDEIVVAARESHILYESEGFPGETYLGSMRYVRVEGKAAVLEQRLVETQSGRAVARAWVVQLLVQRSTVVSWPEEYFDRIAMRDGANVERRPKSDRIWGP